jgi:hypothetical protein
MGPKGASYILYGAGGAVLAALYKIWVATGFDMSVFHSNPDIPGLLEFGAGGAVLGMIVCWFL